jgi:hypothetical protein
MSNRQIAALKRLVSHLTHTEPLVGITNCDAAVDGTLASRVVEHGDDAGIGEAGSALDIPGSRPELPATRDAVACFRSSTRALFQLGFSWDLLVDMMVRVKFEDFVHPFVDRD